MAMLLKGADAARALTEQLREQAEELKKNGTEPCLAILRVGAREDDLSYERGALKRCEKVGITVRQVVLPEDAGQQELMDNIRSLNEDEVAPIERMDEKISQSIHSRSPCDCQAAPYSRRAA